MKRWKHVLGMSALAVATMIGTASAQAPRKGDHMQFMATALDLTDAQVAQINQIRGSNKGTMQANHAQMKSIHEQMKAAITADTFDEAKVRSLIAQQQQVQATAELEHAREMNAIYKVLTPQQKEKAVKLFGNMGFGGPMHGGSGGPGGPAGENAPPPPQD